jgi:Xaa-Pro aminopeptidase
MRYYYSAIKTAKANVCLISDNSLNEFITANKIKKVGLVYSYTSISFLKELENLGVLVFDDTSRVFESTAVKTPREIELIKESCLALENSFKESLKYLKEGITEREFQAKLEYLFKINGGEKPSFDSVIAFGEGSAIPHYKTGDVVLKKDMPVLIDCGLYKNGYASDLTRSFYFGKAPSEYKKAYKAVLNAHNKAFKEISSNLKGSDADKIARDELIKSGYGDYFTHSLGHGVGVKIHEEPRVSKTSNYVLKDGNVFSIEPGVYINGKFGIRIEDTVYLENGKCKSFFKISKDECEFNS